MELVLYFSGSIGSYYVTPKNGSDFSELSRHQPGGTWPSYHTSKDSGTGERTINSLLMASLTKITPVCRVAAEDKGHGGAWAYTVPYITSFSQPQPPGRIRGARFKC